MNVDAGRLVDERGMHVVGRSEENIRAVCPVHPKVGSQGDWYIRTDNGVHQCFSCGFRGDGASLVSAVHGVNRDQAVSWLVALGLTSFGGGMLD